MGLKWLVASDVSGCDDGVSVNPRHMEAFAEAADSEEEKMNDVEDRKF